MHAPHRTRTLFLPLLTCAGLGLSTGCSPAAPEPAPPPTTPTATATEAPPPPPKLDVLSRQRFNALAAQSYLPLFWRADENGNKAVDPSEVAILWGYGEGARDTWLEQDAEDKLAFTERFNDEYSKLVRLEQRGPAFSELDEKERHRRELIIEELSQGKPTLIETDLRKASTAEQALVSNILDAAKLIEQIHARQLGSYGLDKLIPPADSASHMVFFRNQGPWCVAPKTENDPACNAVPSLPPKVSGLYPASLQKDDKFCDKLKARKDGEQLIYQFAVVQGSGDDLKAVPYTQAYAQEMQEISKKLSAAAGLLGDDEKPFQDYLAAAAKAFTDNNWEPADEAWAKMNVKNSKWYLRIAPDEVYFEPCSFKAGFHVSFAKINQGSLRWQEKLGPVKSDMEAALAKLAGAPYKARDVDFHLPDFIDIVLNAGDSRNSSGATIGQSLPNWGPVANEGRGRTVAMTNLYQDPDSMAQARESAASMFCAETMKEYTDEQEPMVMSTVLHEAAHNLGPAHEYKVRGKTDRQIFSGGMASTLEELKAQSAALYFTDWLAEKKLISPELARQAHVRDLAWAFGHISRGMYEGDSTKPKPYSQLAAIQLGWLLEKGGGSWLPDQKAANGTDTGCIQLDLDKFPKAAEALLKEVARIKAKGDVAGANKLKAAYVDKDGQVKALLELIRERWLRAPKATFVYSVDL
ncbi:MAG: hypothetical protein AB7K71_04920 [Polyangiaceae bacterium]